MLQCRTVVSELDVPKLLAEGSAGLQLGEGISASVAHCGESAEDVYALLRLTVVCSMLSEGSPVFVLFRYSFDRHRFFFGRKAPDGGSLCLLFL